METHKERDAIAKRGSDSLVLLAVSLSFFCFSKTHHFNEAFAAAYKRIT